jgi:hypothetical protein
LFHIFAIGDSFAATIKTTDSLIHGEYEEGLWGLCEKNDWRLRKHLPRRETTAMELDTMEKGLGPPDMCSLARPGGFTHWKAAQVSRRATLIEEAMLSP